MRFIADSILTKVVIYSIVFLFLVSCATPELIYNDSGSDRADELLSSSIVIDSLAFVVFQQTDDAMIIANHIEIVDGELVLNMNEKNVVELRLDMDTYLRYKNTIQESNK